MVIIDYNDEWPVNFRKIKEEFEKHLTSYVTIEHIGSTAIKGMCAKPIIDVMMIARDDINFAQIKGELERKFGYFHVGDWGITGREVFKRKNSFRKESLREQELLKNNFYSHNGEIKSETLDTISHNLYVCKTGAEEIRKYRLFRDYLNKNHEEMLRYHRLKQEIIGTYGNNDYELYCKIKEENYSHFFNDIINKAGALT